MTDTAAFYDALVAHGHLVPTGPHGAWGRGAAFEAVLEAFDALVRRTAASEPVEQFTFPPVIDRAIVERTGYLESFPTLCGCIHAFEGDERQALALAARVQRGEPWGDALAQTDLVLNPAACYPFYPTCRGTLPAGGRHVTMLAWVYRQEPSLEPTRLRAFRVREFIRVGTAAEAQAWRDAWLPRGTALLAGLGLEATPEVATDPFFGRTGRMMASGQRQQRLKFEVLVPVNPGAAPPAVCSFNYHLDKFALAFDIRLPTGEPAHTACLGFGLERVTLALFRAHGMDSTQWPEAVRRQLWP
jgi:seryl-tRNA synthetase